MGNTTIGGGGGRTTRGVVVATEDNNNNRGDLPPALAAGKMATDATMPPSPLTNDGNSYNPHHLPLPPFN